LHNHQELNGHSPDLNPIELFFSKLKAILRKASANSIESLWTVG
jgi:transposase